MRVSDKSYDGYVRYLTTVVTKLPVSDTLRHQFHEQIGDYVEVADPVKGLAQPNIKWTRGNARSKYTEAIPGLISEMITQMVLSKRYGEGNVIIAYDEHTQSVLKIDMTVTVDPETTYQSKTIRFEGSKCFINPLWAQGISMFVSLTDIDDHENFVVPMSFIKDNANTWIRHRDLVAASVMYTDLRGMY